MTVKADSRGDMAADGRPILEARRLRKTFGGLIAIDRLDFKVNRSEIIAVIGPNGSGKTTLFNLISGFLTPTEGEILLEGKSLNKLAPSRIAALGVARSFQLQKLFSNMSVVENVMVGCHLQSKAGLLSTGFRLPSARKEEKRIFERAMSRLEMVGLKEAAFSSPLSLPIGWQKTLEIARALSTEPKVLLLDEPAGGLSTLEIEQLARLIGKLREDGVVVMLVEHRMELVMDIADRVIVLNYGAKICEGAPAEIQNDEAVVAAYLGEEF